MMLNYANYNTIKVKLKTRSFSDRELLPYLICVCVLELFSNYVPRLADDAFMLKIVSFVLNVAINVVGIFYRKIKGTFLKTLLSPYILLCSPHATYSSYRHPQYPSACYGAGDREVRHLHQL